MDHQELQTRDQWLNACLYFRWCAKLFQLLIPNLDTLTLLILIALSECAPYQNLQAFFFVLFFKWTFVHFLFFVAHMSYFGATGTPVLDFWWRLLWVSKPEWVLPYTSHCGGECNVHLQAFKCRFWTVDYALSGCLKQGTGVYCSPYLHVLVSVKFYFHIRLQHLLFSWQNMPE